VLTRPAYLLLVLVLLAARVTCAWGLGADPCCGGDDDAHGVTSAGHVVPGEPPHEGGLDHALHAGHCHCLWETVAEVTVVAPAEERPTWGASHRGPPAAEPRGIEWPPKHDS
jgi:hypothetical protein